MFFIVSFSFNYNNNREKLLVIKKIKIKKILNTPPELNLLKTFKYLSPFKCRRLFNTCIFHLIIIKVYLMYNQSREDGFVLEES